VKWRISFLVSIAVAFGATFSSTVYAQESTTWGSSSISYDVDSDTITVQPLLNRTNLAADSMKHRLWVICAMVILI